MKALQFLGPRMLSAVDIAKPVPTANEVLLKIKKVGLCGTDFHIYRGEVDVPVPLVMGHEFVGDIVEVGSNVTNLKVGQRVTAEHVTSPHGSNYPKNISPEAIVYGKHRQGALAEYMAIPVELVYPLPDELSYDEGVIVEPLAVALHAVKRADVKANQRVLVIGQGPIGLFIDAVLQAFGVYVISFDLNKDRLSFALAHGVVQEMLPALKGQSFKDLLQFKATPYVDAVFDCVSVEQTIRDGLSVVKPGGRLVLVGVPVKEVTLPLQRIVFQEVDIIGSSRCDNEFVEVIEMLCAKKLKVSDFITHRYPFSEVIRAFEESIGYSEGRVKTVVEF